MANNLRQNKVILYKLTKLFGARVLFYRPIENEYDLTTGEITRAYIEISVRRAIVLPSKLSREFVYDLSYIASNKNFTYGGYFDETTRHMILKKSQLKGYTPELDWQCDYKNKKYVVKEADETEDGAGYIISCNALDETA